MNQRKGRTIYNLFTVTTSQEALTRLIDGLTSRAGNASLGNVCPDQLAPITRNGDQRQELVKAR